MSQLTTMVNTLSEPNRRRVPFKHNEQRLSSGDHIVIVTNLEHFITTNQRGNIEQQWYRFGAIDLETFELGYYRLSVDDIRALAKANHPVPPFTRACSVGFRYVRDSHKGQRGRFTCHAELTELPPELTPEALALARSYFARLSFNPKDAVSLWGQYAVGPQAEAKLEAACLAATEPFTREQLLKRVPGADAYRAGVVLRRLVKRKQLTPDGKTKGASYSVVSPPSSRLRAIPIHDTVSLDSIAMADETEASVQGELTIHHGDPQ